MKFKSRAQTVSEELPLAAGISRRDHHTRTHANGDKKGLAMICAKQFLPKWPGLVHILLNVKHSDLFQSWLLYSEGFQPSTDKTEVNWLQHIWQTEECYWSNMYNVAYFISFRLWKLLKPKLWDTVRVHTALDYDSASLNSELTARIADIAAK